MNAIQCKMARAALGLGVRDLADQAGVAQATVSRLERGEDLKPSTIAAIQKALEAAGVEFIAENGGGPGVRLVRDIPTRSYEARTLFYRMRGSAKSYFVREMREKDGVALLDRYSPETVDFREAEMWLESGDWPDPK